MALLRWSGSESYLRLPKSETLLEVSAVRTYRIRNCKARNNFVGRPVQYGPPRESPTIIGKRRNANPIKSKLDSDTPRLNLPSTRAVKGPMSADSTTILLLLNEILVERSRTRTGIRDKR